ncbi:hypothetical protein [Streptomyces sp. 840.1]|uniref:hypothetical protein n=1 Tax=Streptomyces sp. 840.1 TaxID=2485152 RepID=UPI001C857ED9|nr:hypothetical protein [Streptomyces sp. 840.1]
MSDEKWGRWFQRAVRLPTEHLEVQLAFPVGLGPVVWGTETSMTAEAAPLRTALAGVEPVPVEEYRQTGRVWAYEQWASVSELISGWRTRP